MSQTNKFLENWKTFKENLLKEVDHFVAPETWANLKTQVNTLVENAKKEVSEFVDQDVPQITAKLKKEKQDLEKLIDKTFKDEIAKAKKFVDAKKKEIGVLQKNLEGYAGKSKETINAKKTAIKTQMKTKGSALKTQVNKKKKAATIAVKKTLKAKKR